MKTIKTKKRLSTYSLPLILRKFNGFTLVEAIVVMAVIAAVSTLGLMRLSTFQKDTLMDSTTNEMVSAIRTAQNKSESGEIPESMDLEDFKEDYAPKYGLRTVTGGYEIFAQYWIEGEPGAVSPSVAAYKVDDTIMVTITGSPLFERLSGASPAFDVNLLSNSGESRQISFNSQGFLEITE